MSQPNYENVGSGGASSGVANGGRDTTGVQRKISGNATGGGGLLGAGDLSGGSGSNVVPVPLSSRSSTMSTAQFVATPQTSSATSSSSVAAGGRSIARYVVQGQVSSSLVCGMSNGQPIVTFLIHTVVSRFSSRLSPSPQKFPYIATTSIEAVSFALRVS